MVITNLTGTAWTIPSGWSAVAGYGHFNVSGHAETGDSIDFTAFDIGYSPYAGVADRILFITVDGGYSHIDASTSFTVTFTGGTDVTNADLISWFEAKGELKEETPKRKLTKLNIGDVVASSGGKCFRRLTTEQPITQIAGLYDANDNLVASWDTLVNTYGMNCEKDYHVANFNIAKSNPHYVLTKTSELSNGTKLIIDSGVTRIGENTIRECRALTHIAFAFGSQLTSIGGGAFCHNSSLTSITIPNGVTSIGDSAFGYCPITSITIPNGVTIIPSCAFDTCRRLTTITIPDSVTTIGSRAFDYCSNFTDVYYKGTAEQWAAISIGTFNEALTSATIHYNYTG